MVIWWLQSRTAFCEDTSGNIVDSSNCDAVAPLTTQDCNQVVCPDYSWFASAWTECPVTCGGGEQTRAIYCKVRGGCLFHMKFEVSVIEESNAR